MAKITIVGAGAVGSQTAFNLAVKDFADIVLIDIVEGLPQGKALDILESMPVFDSNSKILGTNNYEDTKNSDIVIMTAGLPRKPGMTRDDLVQINAKILNSVIPEIVKYSPNCILIIVTNPLTVMTQLAYKISSFPKNRVMGMAGVLDSSRFKAFVSKELDVRVEDIDAFVLGDHGDLMVPLISKCKIKDKPITEFLDNDDLNKIVERVKNAGGEIISLLKNASTSFAPASALVEMVDCILNDKKKILPCTTFLEGEYGINNLFIGVPVKLGKSGVEEIINIPLSDDEKVQFQKSADHIKDFVKNV